MNEVNKRVTMADEESKNSRLRPDFTSVNYWDERFQEEESYDWLVKYNQISDVISRQVNKGDKLLMLGCGNSTLSEEMYQDGYVNIVNVDFSDVCIEKMREKHQHCPGMEWMVMDIKDLKFADGSFDVVIEKGTLDALLCNEKDPWRVSDAGFTEIETAISQVSRVLKQNGKFISITFVQPHFRRPLFARTMYGWGIDLTQLGTDFFFFLFTMEKGKTLSTIDVDLEKTTILKRSETNNSEGTPIQMFEDKETEESFLTAFSL